MKRNSLVKRVSPRRVPQPRYARRAGPVVLLVLLPACTNEPCEFTHGIIMMLTLSRGG